MRTAAVAVLASALCAFVAAGCGTDEDRESLARASKTAGQRQVLDCPLWNISPSYARAVFGHSNGWWVYFDLNQNISSLDGPVRGYYPAPWLGAKIFLRGTVQGRVERSPEIGTGGVRGDAAINFTIRWSSGAIGIYTGKISRWGYASGTAWDLRNPASKASWTLHPSATSCT